MPTDSSAPAPTPRPLREMSPSGERSASRGDDQLFSKLHSVAMQAALSVLLSLFGLGSAMAQSVDQDMALGANTRATRDRVISEISQARADGKIKRWSPLLVEVPVRAPLKGSRFAPFATHPTEGAGHRFVARDDVGQQTTPPRPVRSRQLRPLVRAR